MFTFTGHQLSCEASDMGNRHLQPLYDNSTERGFAVKSDKTGAVVKFMMTGVHKDAEGDITHWTYVACHEDVRLNPGAMFTTATIWND